jgi:hypothetical protein
MPAWRAWAAPPVAAWLARGAQAAAPRVAPRSSRPSRLPLRQLAARCRPQQFSARRPPAARASALAPCCPTASPTRPARLAPGASLSRCGRCVGAENSKLRPCNQHPQVPPTPPPTPTKRSNPSRPRLTRPDHHPGPTGLPPGGRRADARNCAARRHAAAGRPQAGGTVHGVPNAARRDPCGWPQRRHGARA